MPATTMPFLAQDAPTMHVREPQAMTPARGAELLLQRSDAVARLHSHLP